MKLKSSNAAPANTARKDVTRFSMRSLMNKLDNKLRDIKNIFRSSKEEPQVQARYAEEDDEDDDSPTAGKKS